MRDSREILNKQVETAEIERPFEPQIPAVNGGYGAYRDISQPDGFQLVTYWRIIRKRFWLVIGIAVLLTTLTAIYMARKPDVFLASARVQVDSEQTNPDLIASDRKPGMINQDASYFNTQLQLLTSSSLLRRVVKELDLENNKEFAKAKAENNVSALRSMLKAIGLVSSAPEKSEGGVDEITASPGGSLASSEEIAEAVRLAPYVEIIKKTLGTEPIRESRGTNKDTRLIEITYRHTNPELAAMIVNGVSEVFAKINQEKRTGTSSKTSDFLTKRIAELQSEIRNDENKLVQLTKEVGILKTDGDEGTIVLNRLSGLNKDLLEVENERKNAQAEYESVSTSPDRLNSKAEGEILRYTTERENVIQSIINRTQESIAGLKARKEQLLIEFVETAPEIKEIDTQIASLKKDIDNVIANNKKELKEFRERTTKDILNQLKTKYIASKSKEDSIKSAYNAQYNQAQGQNQSAVSLKLLEQGIEEKKGFVQNLIKTQRENDVNAIGTDNNITVAEIAIPPDVPVGPKRLTTVVAMLFLSTLFGMGLALFLEYLDDTIRTTEEVESLLQLPALAAIPRIDMLPKRRLLLVGGKEDDSNADLTSELLIHNDSRSSLAEAYRQLRTSILLSTAGHAPKSLLITSSLPAEGKTTTAVNTAISLAQTGAKVLIIDADMRRPRLHSIFNISNTGGLSTLLSTELADENLIDVISYDEESKLNLLTSGPVPPNPAELIGSEQMANLLKKLQTHFTHIVIDSPPIASFTDGVLIASMVDGVILVVHSGKSSRQIIRRSKQLLQDIGVKIFGVVLNNVNLNAQDNSYYYQSYYHRDNYRQDEEE